MSGVRIALYTAVRSATRSENSNGSSNCPNRNETTSKKITPATAAVTMISDNLVAVSEADAPKVLKLIELLEALDDVKNVYANFDIPDAVMEKMVA